MTVMTGGAARMTRPGSALLTAAFFISVGALSPAGADRAGSLVTVQRPASQAIAKAMIKAHSGDTVMLEDGVYREQVAVDAGVTLVARTVWGAVVDGGGRGTAVTMGKGASVVGLEIRDAYIGLLSNAQHVTVSKCRIVGHFGSGILCIGWLPVIENNVIANNRGSGIQMQNARSDGTGAVRHNTIVYNATNGVTVDGASSTVLCEYNIIAFNERLGIKVGGATDRVQVINNDIYENRGQLDEAPSGNFTADPLFIAPKARKPDFGLQQNSPCREKDPDGHDLGAQVAR